MRIDLAEDQTTWAPAARGPLRARLLVVAEDAARLAWETLAIARAARAAGYDVHLAAPAPGADTAEDQAARIEIEAAGLAFHEIAAASDKKALGRWSRFKAFDRLVARLKPDLIHCLGLIAVTQMGAIARLRRLPAVLALPGWEEMKGDGHAKRPLRRFLRLWGVAFALGNPRASVVVRDPEDRAHLVRACRLDPRHSFLVRGRGIDLSVFRPRAPAERAPGPPLVVLAALAPLAADVHCLADAARRLRARGIALRCVVTAPSPGTADAVAGRAPDRTLREGLEWRGPVSDFSEMLREADLAVLPAPQMRGDTALMVEAAALGLPLIAAETPAARRIVRPGTNGYLVPARNALALEVALERLVSDAAHRESAGARSREIAEAEYSLPAYLTAALVIYRATLAGPESARWGTAGPRDALSGLG